MSRFKAIFPKPYTFLPVIHTKSRDQVLRNVELAMSNGADGVFLINHGGRLGSGDVHDLIEYYHAARERFPDAWIGLNMLGMSNRDAIGHIPETGCALWTDNAGVDDSSDGRAHDFYKSARKSGWHGMHFGGVAFKYQAEVNNLESVARRALPFVDVITTSGVATGEPPTTEKVFRIRKGAGRDAVIAIASGLTHRNVHEYHHADCFLVASALLQQDSFFEFDELKLIKFGNSVYDMNQKAIVPSSI